MGFALWFWFYTLLQLRDCLFSEETMSVGLLNRAKTVIDFGDFDVVLNEVLYFDMTVYLGSKKCGDLNKWPT